MGGALTPFQVLYALTQGSPEASAFELLDWARAQVPAARARGHGPVRIPGEHVEDVVIDTLLRLHTLATTGDQRGTLLAHTLMEGRQLPEALRLPQVVLAQPPPPHVVDLDRALRSYFRLMLGSAWLSRLRQERRARAYHDQMRAEQEPATAPEPEQPESEPSERLQEARDALGQALRYVIAHRAADPALLEASVRQLWGLRDGSTDMMALAQTEADADRELASRSDGWKTARERLYRRHRLTRRYLREAADHMAADGLDPATVSLLHQTLDGLTRRRARSDHRPIPPRNSVSEEEENP